MSDQLIELAKSHLPNIPLTVISQGAEAIIFRTETHPYLPSEEDEEDKKKKQYIIKYRPPKKYRHPQLDATLTKHRTIAEARLLQKLTNLSNVLNCPRLIALDAKNGILWMEHVGYLLEENGEISSLKNWLWRYNHDNEKALQSEIEQGLRKVGGMIGELHKNDLIHGDLTSSNIIMTKTEGEGAGAGAGGEPCLIDFGLSFQSGLVEDKAVDLYVLERAILSTHPLYSDKYNQWLMEGYEGAFKEKKDKNKLKEIIRRYEDVRLRGRKRSMLG